MRRYFAGILVVLAIAVLGVHAEDFWVKTEWKNWSEYDTKWMLDSSPWTAKWQYWQVVFAPPLDPEPARNPTIGNARTVDMRYYVQDWSSIPVREAAVRQLQFVNNYAMMDDAHKKAFDAQAEKSLS